MATQGIHFEGNDMETLPAILMVDDNPGNLFALKAALDLSGVDLVRAGSGADALRQVLQRDFALILMDVNMPGMDGFETATLIRQRQRSSRTPIIFVTADAPDTVKQLEGYAAGAVDYLFKPVDPTILRSKVQVFIEIYRHAELKLRAATMEAANRQLEQDLETQARLADQLAHLTQHDLLTGLANRIAMEQRLTEALGAALPGAHSVAVILTGLEGMDDVIATLGHTAGDALLQEAAARLRGVVQGNQLVACIGAGEFALVLPDLAGGAGAVSAARRIIEVLAAPFEATGSVASIRPSAGIAVSPHDGKDATSLLRSAEVALAQARREGGNGWRFCKA